ncbi:MAG: hypothetical protein AMJ60_03410 [Desulfobacterales bacterium SG8_35]|nr:MAG: hypothetical protein AMJ60_03410 [Desulfobacterales bacterium SG8_35]
MQLVSKLLNGAELMKSARKQLKFHGAFVEKAFIAMHEGRVDIVQKYIVMVDKRPGVAKHTLLHANLVPFFQYFLKNGFGQYSREPVYMLCEYLPVWDN